MRLLAFITSLTIVLTCCKNPRNEPESQKLDHIRSQNVLRPFILSSTDELTRNDNLLVFGKTDPHDTSFVLSLMIDSKLFSTPDAVRPVRCYYYQTSTIYHVNIRHFLSEEDRSLYIDGFTFNIDTTTWRKILKEAEPLLTKPSDTPYVNCNDCSHYTIINGSRLVYAWANVDKFVEFETFLKRQVLNKIFKQKRTFSERIEP